MAAAIIALFALAVLMLVKQFSSGGSDTVQDLGGDVDTSADSVTQKIARAIATAEGFFAAGSRPARNHNPGDMTADLIGKSTGTDGAFVTYDNDEDGWANLYAQVNAWLQGTSRYHGPLSTIADLAGLGSETGYTTTDQQAWANTVAQVCGVTTDTSLGDIGA
jgi:hypothetical protein